MGKEDGSAANGHRRDRTYNRKLAFYCTCDPTGARLRLTLGMIEGGVDTLLVLFCIVCL